jgi:predicted amidohydrolase YtcJ
MFGVAFSRTGAHNLRHESRLFQSQRDHPAMTDPERPLLIRADRIRVAPGSQAAGPDPDAILLRAGRVVAAGDMETLRAQEPDAVTVDLPGCTVTPGLTDAHVHILEWAQARRGVNLARVDSPRAAAEAVAEHALRGAGTGWIIGRGWNAHRWPEPPTRQHLDAVLPHRPVLLQSMDMHSVWANSAALQAAGITPSTPDPEGGRIERDAAGAPTGVLRENAMPLLQKAAPPPSDADHREACIEAQADLHRLGITGFHTVEPDSLAILERLRHEDRLRLRVLQHLPLWKLDDAIRLGIRSGFGGEWIRIGGIKMFLDGALGSLTALLREPYEGSNDRGVSTLPPEVFRDAVRRGSAAGLAMTVHAIGDAAVDLALDTLTGEDARIDGPVPHRIEHVQLVAADRLGGRGGRVDPALRGLVCSMQPSHLMTDWPAIDKHWGERGRWAYAFRSLEAAGAILALGSDAPVDPPDPRLGLHAAVTRTDATGSPAEGWYPEERLDAARALAGYTAGPARAAGDDRQGRLAPGCFADLVAWDRDPVDAGADGLLEMQPVLTIVGGEAVWSRDA